MEVLIFSHRRNHDYNQARVVFRDIVMKNIDWPEAIWDAWLAFEQAYGSAQEMDDCQDKIERARNQVNAKRAKVRVNLSLLFVVNSKT